MSNKKFIHCTLRVVDSQLNPANTNNVKGICQYNEYKEAERKKIKEPLLWQRAVCLCFNVRTMRF
jgi:hypothetical protein